MVGEKSIGLSDSEKKEIQLSDKKKELVNDVVLHMPH